MMNCPVCGSKTYVIDARVSNKYKDSLRRRRMCYKCRSRFSTYEVLPEVLAEGEKANELLTQIYHFLKKKEREETQNERLDLNK